MSHNVLQGKPVCIAFAQQGGQKPALSLGILDHVMGMDTLHSALHDLLTVLHVSLEDRAGLHELLQWVKTHSRC